VALLGIYLASTIVRTLFRGFTFTNFETAQCALAFVISVGGGLRLSSHDARVAPAIAILSLACAAACYLVGFRVLDRGRKHGRNFYTYSTFGILLAIAGSRILLSGFTAALTWSTLAVIAIWAGGALGCLALQVHGSVYLLAGVVASGALQQAAGLLLGYGTWPGSDQWPIWAGAATAAICYSLGIDSQPLRTANAAVLTWLTAGIAASLLTSGYHATFGVAATHAYCATLRTAVIAAAALLIARTGKLATLIYPLMLLGAWRLVTVDLHQDRKAALFLSLLLYGATLIILPRILRAASVTAAESSHS
jgi:hypothetical protein